MEQYEYVAVVLPGRLRKDYDRAVTEELNKVAAYGWRLQSVIAETPALAIFERPK